MVLQQVNILSAWKYGENGCSDVTTRENRQFHGVLLCDLSEIL